jgi:hypothetical protein
VNSFLCCRARRTEDRSNVPAVLDGVPDPADPLHHPRRLLPAQARHERCGRGWGDRGALGAVGWGWDGGGDGVGWGCETVRDGGGGVG